jgi:hypothetical protein
LIFDHLDRLYWNNCPWSFVGKLSDGYMPVRNIDGLFENNPFLEEEKEKRCKPEEI